MTNILLPVRFWSMFCDAQTFEVNLNWGVKRLLEKIDQHDWKYQIVEPFWYPEYRDLITRMFPKDEMAMTSGYISFENDSDAVQCKLLYGDFLK